MKESTNENEVESGHSTVEEKVIENGVLLAEVKLELGRQHEEVVTEQSRAATDAGKGERCCLFKVRLPNATAALYSRVSTYQRECIERWSARLSLSETATLRSQIWFGVVWPLNNHAVNSSR